MYDCAENTDSNKERICVFKYSRKMDEEFIDAGLLKLS